MLSDYTWLQLAAGASGAFFWSLAYLLILVQSFTDQTYGVPFPAICMNLAWEITFFIFPPADLIQRSIHLVWLTLDVGIVYTLLRFGPKELGWSRKQIASTFAGGVGICIAIMWGLVYAIDDSNGRYSAFTDDAIMAWLFVRMLLVRQDLRGQSSDIGLCILLGSVSYYYLFYTLYPESRYLFIMYVLTFSGNMVYFLLLQILEYIS